jgi:hypothetical protein
MAVGASNGKLRANAVTSNSPRIAQMDTQLFLQQLPILLQDPTGIIYNQTLCQTSMVTAVRAYRRWRQCLRPFGTGILYSAATAGASVIQVCGGTWTIGQSLTIMDQFGSETFTLLGISPGTLIPNWMGTPLALTLSGELASNHAAGVQVTVLGTIPGAGPGLNIYPGQNFYPLPSDFVRFENVTWQLANGTQCQVKQVEYFYDGAYVYSQMLSGVGWGQAQTFISQMGLGGYGIGFVGVPNSTGTLNIPYAGNTQTVFQVQPGNPPQLYMYPAQQAQTTWQFNYFATHQPETVPDEDFDAVMDAAKAVATQAQLEWVSTLPNLRDIRQEEFWSAAAANLLKVAEQSMKGFFDKIVARPFFLLG